MIRKFANGAGVEFSQGRIDGWRVSIINPDGTKWAPKDADYFSWLAELGGTYGEDRVYGDFVQVYDQTGSTVSDQVLDAIEDIAAGYGTDSVKADVTFTVLYLTMISEENRANTKLGRRIKRLGAYEVLINQRPLDDAMNFMKGMGWKKIDRLCGERGF